MTSVAVRLTKLEAARPPQTSEPEPAYDLSRLRPDQLERMSELRERIDEVGRAGLTNGEVDELAAMSEVLMAPDLTEHTP